MYISKLILTCESSEMIQINNTWAPFIAAQPNTNKNITGSRVNPNIFGVLNFFKKPTNNIFKRCFFIVQKLVCRYDAQIMIIGRFCLEMDISHFQVEHRNLVLLVNCDCKLDLPFWRSTTHWSSEILHCTVVKWKIGLQMGLKEYVMITWALCIGSIIFQSSFLMKYCKLVCVFFDRKHPVQCEIGLKEWFCIWYDVEPLNFLVFIQSWTYTFFPLFSKVQIKSTQTNLLPGKIQLWIENWRN